MNDSTFITRVVLRDYKSIAACDVSLGPLTFLVGPNGSGKSNFLDAPRFVAEALTLDLDQAVRARGGADALWRRSGSRPPTMSIRLEFVLPSGATGHYAFKLGGRSFGANDVLAEECVVRHPDAAVEDRFFRSDTGDVRTNVATPPVVLNDRL